MGQYAGKCNETGSGNVFLGWGAGHYTTHTYGTFVGHRSGANTTGGSLDVAIGRRAGQGYGQKCCNTFVGSYAGENATSATCNTMVGAAAGRNVTTGDSNVVIGHNVCLPNASDSNCFLLGSGTNRWITGDSSYNVDIPNTLSKGGGSFKIDHPHPTKTETHHLVHSFIEGPQMDLIYRGKVDLVDGTAIINIDTKSGMTDGTFVLLNKDIQSFTTNETGWGAVKSSVSGNILTITAQDNTSTDTISWMVIGERQDDIIKSLTMTNDEGDLIVEPLKS